MKINPDIVFIPSSLDNHQDHNVIYSEGVRAFKTCNIYGYEFAWNQFEINSRLFIKLNEEHVHKKIKSIKEYKSQSFRKYTNENFLKSVLENKGILISTKYAESFEAIRVIM